MIPELGIILALESTSYEIIQPRVGFPTVAIAYAEAKRAAEFAKRLTDSCNKDPRVPNLNRGRLTWLRRRLKETSDVIVSVETVRKWFSGDSKPRDDKLRHIARLLEVDEAWLSLGVSQNASSGEQCGQIISVNGAVNLVAGLIQMSGGHPAFPAVGDLRATEAAIDLYAVIKRTHYAFHIELAQSVGDGFRFMIPINYQNAVQIGVIRRASLVCHLVKIPSGLIEAGIDCGDKIELIMTENGVAAIRMDDF